jgi:predicted nucleotidyltransferase
MMAVNVEELRRRHVASLESELARIVAELKRLGAQRIVLFGSYARGRRDLFTDLDLLVILETEKPFLERLLEVKRAVAPRVATDLLVYTPAEFAELETNAFWRNALADSRVLYARE